jgi:hypothetical protein
MSVIGSYALCFSLHENGSNHYVEEEGSNTLATH